MVSIAEKLLDIPATNSKRRAAARSLALTSFTDEYKAEYEFTDGSSLHFSQVGVGVYEWACHLPNGEIKYEVEL